ncbi:MAG: PLDc N-terminal domain-containing protein [Chitinophagaceae bacterium]
MPFFANNYFYIITIVLQAICVLHCIRRGRQNNWIWLIVFLPVIGCLIYFFTEIVTRREVHNVQTGVGAVFNPGGRIKRLEENIKVSDAFENKVALADAYLAAGQTMRAIELYEWSLDGNFEENEYVLSQLIIAYFQAKRFEEIIPIAKKIYKRPQFARSKAHILYALALDYTGNSELAETEFKTMKARFSNFEARYQYGLFLIRANRKQEAQQLFAQIVDEASHLSSQEKGYNRGWITLAKDELRKMKI